MMTMLHDSDMSSEVQQSGVNDVGAEAHVVASAFGLVMRSEADADKKLLASRKCQVCTFQMCGRL